MADDSSKNKNVWICHLREGQCTIGFEGYIYNDYRDGHALQEVIVDLLKPEVNNGFGGPIDMWGSFVKDGIKVKTYWHEIWDYDWTIDTVDPETEQKVFGWANEVYDEYIRRNSGKEIEKGQRTAMDSVFFRGSKNL